MEQTLLFNELPRPTFRWLKANHTEGTIWSGNTAGTLTVEGNKAIVSDFTSLPVLNADYVGVDAVSLKEVAESFDKGILVSVPKGAEEAVSFVLDVEGEVSSKVRIRLQVEEDAKLDVKIALKGSATGGHVSTFIEVDGKANSETKITKVQLLEGKVQQFEHRYTQLGENATADFVNIELGAEENYLNYRDELVGDSSNINHSLGYCGFKEQKFDISMLMSHIGKKTGSDIHNVGAIKDFAKKSFRGTLDFHRGSIASEGGEEDTCLLLSPTVKSVSLPLLLCKEDNVSGNHAASAGQIDQAKLFYIMSRGFSEVEAKHMIVESMLRPLIDCIGNEELEELTLAALHKKI